MEKRQTKENSPDRIGILAEKIPQAPPVREGGYAPYGGIAHDQIDAEGRHR